ncbi:MAG: hypothetical protein JW849_06955 [Phycisphaerae bacterium]|nr:hypothetical protein [Phycisphaerae bacterium]
MTEHTNPSEASTSGIIVTCLYVVAGLSVVAGVLVSIAWLLQSPREEGVTLEAWAHSAESLMFGVVAACLLWSAAWIIRRREEATISQRRMLRVLLNLHHHDESPSPAAAEHSSRAAGEADVMPRVLRQLTELNANVLLSDAERQEKRRKMKAELAETLSNDIESALLDRRYDDAGDLLPRLKEVAPNHERLVVFHSQVETGQEEQVRELISGQVRRASDLMSVSRYEEAVEVAEQLRRTYPRSREADELLTRVQREAATYHTERRSRLFAIIQEHSQARQWKQALAGAHKLLETYAESDEAEKVRAMMPTFVDNARIQEVRELRDRIVELMERHRYAEALPLVRQVVENFPETAAAEELRPQLLRLQELARSEKNHDEKDET